MKPKDYRKIEKAKRIKIKKDVGIDSITLAYIIVVALAMASIVLQVILWLK